MSDVSKKVNGLGLRIAQSRTKLNISQNIISDLIGIPRPNYTSIENETSNRFLKDYQLKLIAQKLNVSSDYLLGLISDPSPNAEMMAIVNSLGISSDSIKFIKSLHSPYRKKQLYTFDNFIKSYDYDFWELIYLYKRVKSFYDNEYSFVLQFTNDIEIHQINILYDKLEDIDNVEPNCKYFYYNLDDARKFFNVGKKILKNPQYSIDEAINKLLYLTENEGYTELYVHLYKDECKLEEFKNDLIEVKKILHDLIMLLDSDETGLIFSTSNKEEEICECIDKLLHLIQASSSEGIDNILQDLNACLMYFNKTVSYSLNFIKYKINDTFNIYFEKDL